MRNESGIDLIEWWNRVVVPRLAREHRAKAERQEQGEPEATPDQDHAAADECFWESGVEVEGKPNETPVEDLDDWPHDC